MNNEVTLRIEGKLDSTGAPEFDRLFDETLKESDNIILDFSGAEYVTSIGLRSLLAAQKKINASNGAMKLINVPDALTEIFEMTGFVNFLNIE